MLLQGTAERRSRSWPGHPSQCGQCHRDGCPLEIRAIGNVQAYSTVQVKAQVGGPMTGVYFKEGQDVKRGISFLRSTPGLLR